LLRADPILKCLRETTNQRVLVVGFDEPTTTNRFDDLWYCSDP
jgi:hypothetical protein